MIKNNPYQYVYFNELVGGIDGAYGKYETDYYGLSMREGIEWLVKNRGLDDGRKVRIGVNCEVETANYWAKKYSGSITIVWNRHYEKHKNQWDYALFASRTMSQAELINGSYPPEGTVHTIKVDNTPILAIIEYDQNYLHKGYNAFFDGNIDEAIQMFSAAASFDPRNEEAIRMLGNAYYSAGNYDQALAAFDEAIEIWPESYLSHYYKSLIHLNQADYQDAYSHATLAIKHKINLQGSHMNAAQASMQMERFSQSRGHLQDAYMYSGGNRNSQSDIHRLMGQSYLMENQSTGVNLSEGQRLSNLQNAANQLAQAINLNPANRTAIQFIIPAFEQLGDQDNANKYRQMLGSS